MERFTKLLLIFISVCLVSQAKIYDAFPFFNELELLAIRLEELDPIVDHFILVEATKTFSGNPKPLHFSENRSSFEPYLHKIIHIVVDDFPFIDPTTPLIAQPWIIETHQRNALVRGLLNASDNDLVIVTDLDEIPHKEAILEAQRILLQMDKSPFQRISSPLFIGLEMPFFYYQLNLYKEIFPFWNKGYVTLRKYLKHHTADKMRMAPHVLSIPTAGWHFSYQGGIDRVLYKLDSFSHCHEFSSKHKEELKENFEQRKRSDFIVLPFNGILPARIKRLWSEYEKMGWIAQ